eukprot:5295950-Prymnesium_polylepis.1
MIWTVGATWHAVVAGLNDLGRISYLAEHASDIEARVGQETNSPWAPWLSETGDAGGRDEKEDACREPVGIQLAGVDAGHESADRRPRGD